MARPTIDEKEKRNIRFTFRLNQREEEMLIRLMAYTEKSGADVIRDLLFKERILNQRSQNWIIRPMEN